MDRYTQALKILESAFHHAECILTYTRQLREAEEIRQHLTSTYGTERVSSSPVYVNPAQRAIEAHEQRIAELAEKITNSTEVITKARLYVSYAGKSNVVADTLDMHYISGWSINRIAKEKHCSISTVKRRRDIGLEIIKNRIKKEAEA